MGTVITTIEVGDPNGQNFQELQLEVDTGSNYSALPREMLQALGSQLKHQCSPVWPTAAWR